jgi:acyl-CoA synthetase (AMP-forming)/AMP-acid ligase II
VVRGDRVAIYTGNTLEAAVAVYGVLLSGAAFVLIDRQVKAEKLGGILADCGAVAAIVDAGLIPTFADALETGAGALNAVFVAGATRGDAVDRLSGAGFPSDRAVIDLDEVLLGTVSHAADDPTVPRGEGTSLELPFVNPLDLAALIYTSGSTGEPKGVMMTHHSMRFAVESLVRYLRLSADDRIVNFLPLSFDYGLYQLLMGVHLGATVVIEPSFVYPSQIIQAVRNHEITVFPGVPTVYSMLVSLYRKNAFTLPTVRRVTNTAAALDDHLIPDLKRIFPNAQIYKMYGLTECKRVSYLEPEELEDKPGSVGRAIPGTEVFLRTPEDAPTRPGEAGILHVRGPHVMLGYWNKPERTSRMLKPGQYPYERVLCTGDWFRMDEEGYLYFQGRSDNIIKSRGEKVSPVEVEAMIRTLDSVQEAAVIGVEDDVLGQAVVAYVEPRPGMTVSERDVKRHCLRHLEGFMVPKYVSVIPTMPKNSNGKVDKTRLPAVDWDPSSDGHRGDGRRGGDR